MERLTSKDGVYMRCEGLTHCGVYDKLKEYEDLGVTPADIAYMAKFFKDHTSAEYIANEMHIIAKLLGTERKKAHWVPVQEHMWRMDGDEVDTWAWDSEYHNGPICEVCGARPCVNCSPNWENTECYDVSYRCSECNAHKKDKTNFCPDCGAEMEVT